MRRKVLAVTAVVALNLALMVWVESPAQAAFTDCPAGNVCLWSAANYTGILDIVHRAPGTCYNIPSMYNDRADSFYNHLGTGKHVQFYRHVDCNPDRFNTHPSPHHDTTEWAGPFPDGYHDAFIAVGTPLVHNDRNNTSSIFFNTG
jgi:hypothetical protein